MTATSAHDGDGAALMALYHATNGDGWARRDNWGMGDRLDDWHGVTTDADGRVVRLNLSSNELSGSIPEALGNLSALTILRLANNELSGSIPEGLGRLTALTSLHLDNNELSGSIPEGLRGLSTLTDLHLDNNKLSGSIPEALGGLTTLTDLHLDNNKLSGSIPEALGDLSALTYLHLDNNELSGSIPETLGNLTALTSLYLDNNKLSGSIPEALGDLSRLAFLNLHSNKLSGSIPEALSNLGALDFLGLHDNQLSGAIPETLGDLAALTVLSLYNNELSGSIPEALSNLAALDFLALANNELSGAIPEALGNLTALTILGLDNNELSGAIPEALGELTALTHLGLSGNQLSGVIPEALGNFAALEYLGLDGNELGGSIPEVLGDLTTLTHLGISGNQLSGSIPEALGNLTALQYLGLVDNELSGAIPETLGNLAALTDLGLANNELSGSIPETLSNLAALDTLWLDDNNLIGSIPEALGELIALRHLSLGDNQLSGSIPEALGNLTALALLDLRGNQLSGSIPETLSNLAALEYLALNNNELGGSIPEALGDLGMLTDVHLDNNKLSGEIPEALGNLSEAREMRFAGNADLKVADRPAENWFDLRTRGRLEDIPALPFSTFEVHRGMEGVETSSTLRVDAGTQVVDASSEKATFHRYAVAPINLYGKRDGAIQSRGGELRARLASIRGWKELAVEDLRPVFAHDTLRSKLGMHCVEAYEYVGRDGFLEGKDDRGAYAVLFGNRNDEAEESGIQVPPGEDGQGLDSRVALSLVLHERIRLEATDPDPGMHQRIKWVMSLVGKPPEWLRSRLPYNPPVALARAVWLWWYRRSLRHKWRDEATRFVRERYEELRREPDLPQGDEHVFIFSALEMHPSEQGSEGREEDWREHFTTTVLALDILNALDDDIPLTLQAMEAEEFGRGAYRQLMQSHRRLRDLEGDSDADDLVPPALSKAWDEISGTGGEIPGTLESIDLEEAHRGLERYLVIRGPRRLEDGERLRERVGEGGAQPRESAGFGLDWRDLEDERHNHALVAAEADTITLTTSNESHVLEMAALEIALHSVASEFAAASGAILENHRARPSRERDEAEDELLDSLSDQLLRVTRWRTQLTGWSRAIFERLQAASRLDENIQAFYDASRESVQRAQIREQKAASEREGKFQRVVALAGAAFAAVVLGEITISIGEDSDVGNTVAVLLGGGALFFGIWLAWSLHGDRPALGDKQRTVLIRSAKVGPLVLTAFMLATMLATLLGASVGDWWWPWPGLPILCVCVGASAVITLFHLRQREGWLPGLFSAARGRLQKPRP